LSTGNRRALLEPLEARRLMAAGDLLPDLVPSANALNNRRYGASPMWAPGRTLLRFDNLVGNLGKGPLEIAAEEIVEHPRSGQLINVSQRIYNSSGGYTSRQAGVMEFHDEGSHHHFHFEEFAQYNLRSVEAGGGVGEIVREGTKAGFCLRDSAIVSPFHPGRPGLPQYNDCYPVGGISVGWGDLYDLTIDYQWIDVTDLAPGQYYLESIADPTHRLLETNEDNNTTRVLITVNVPRLGDATGDGAVTAADLKVVLSNLGQSNRTWNQGDFTGDGKVTLADYQVLEVAWNQPSPDTAPVPPAPTPATAAKAPVKRLNPVLEAPVRRPLSRRG
jgi:hypothetical protein